MTTLSSRWTFVAKYLFPFVWIAGFGSGIIMMLLHPERVVMNGVRGAVTGRAVLLFVGIWILGTAAVVASGWRMKRVRVDGGDLLVSNYLREVRVPLSNVREVRDDLSSRNLAVTIDFVDATPWGCRVTFLAQRRPWKHGRDGQVPEELRRLVAAARER